MDYFIAKKIKEETFESLDQKVREELQKEGFGVLTEIDVQKTLKEKIDVDFHKYKILGACNPGFAYRALSADDKIGSFLPCNVIIQETKSGDLELMAFDPASAMMAVDKPELAQIATEVREKLTRVLDNID
ncbi:DUF302 domain-containing protein [Bacteroidota bacterium]